MKYISIFNMSAGIDFLNFKNPLIIYSKCQIIYWTEMKTLKENIELLFTGMRKQSHKNSY